MKREEWEDLSRPDQLSVIHAMQESTVQAWAIPNIVVERMLNGFWDRAERLAERAKP